MKNGVIGMLDPARVEMASSPKKLVRRKLTRTIPERIADAGQNAISHVVGKFRRSSHPPPVMVEERMDSIGPVASAIGEFYEKQAKEERRFEEYLDAVLASREEEMSATDLFRLLKHFIENGGGLTESAREKAIEDITRRLQTKLEDEEDSLRKIKDLFENWAPEYDPHMKSTGHDEALETVLRQAIELRRLDFGGSSPVLGEHILEMSGGTGTVVDLLCDNLDPEEKARLTVTLNDVSPHMVERAKKKLAGKCDVEYTSCDMRDLGFGAETFSGAILSQTLHLITDDELLRAERSPDEVVETDHRGIKTEVIRKAFELLKWDGYFALIDEWPAKLTDHSRNPKEKFLEQQFMATFRPIPERSTARDKMMRGMKGARFVAELKARIDARHSMYMLLYRKDRDKVERRGKYLPAEGPDAGMADHARKRAVKRIINAFTRIDRHFRKTYTPKNGERKDWTEFIPVGDDMIINPVKRQLEEKGKYGTIVLSGELHNKPHEERLRMVTECLDALKVGGSIMFIDEWKAPEGSKNPLRKTDLRDVIMDGYQTKRQVIFEGCLRQHIKEGFDSGMYGYLFRKIRKTD